MRLIDRYVASNVIASTLTVLLTLLAIFTFFALIDELEDVGRGSYGIVNALIFVAMSAPSLAYELFPMAALIGSLLGLGTMMRNGEIVVIRCAGVSKFRVVVSVMKAGLLFVIDPAWAEAGMPKATVLRAVAHNRAGSSRYVFGGVISSSRQFASCPSCSWRRTVDTKSPQRRPLLRQTSTGGRTIIDGRFPDLRGADRPPSRGRPQWPSWRVRYPLTVARTVPDLAGHLFRRTGFPFTPGYPGHRRTRDIAQPAGGGNDG